MITDHSGVNRQAVALATRLNVTPEDNDVSRQLRSGADRARAALQGLTGAAFDPAYVAREVEYHRAVLDAIRGHDPEAARAAMRDLLDHAAEDIRNAKETIR